MVVLAVNQGFYFRVFACDLPGSRRNLVLQEGFVIVILVAYLCLEKKIVEQAEEIKIAWKQLCVPNHCCLIRTFLR